MAEPAYPTEVAEIEATIKRLVEVAQNAERFPCGHPLSQGKPYTASDFAHRSDAEVEVSSIIGRPMRWAARRAVRALGRRLNEIGGRQLMLDVCHRVAGEDGRVLSFIDHAFDGVGSWLA